MGAINGPVPVILRPTTHWERSIMKANFMNIPKADEIVRLSPTWGVCATQTVSVAVIGSGVYLCISMLFYKVWMEKHFVSKEGTKSEVTAQYTGIHGPV